MITIAILQGQIERITSVKSTISCTDGKVWVTQDGFLEDTILHKGESLIIKTTGLTLVNAIVDAVIQVANAVPESIRTRSAPESTVTAPTAIATPSASSWLLSEPLNHTVIH
ncbi:MAG: DUF2917 domain-containing protein [Glaciimonas sp.]|nr:DUF2917 domain-containing protein [Glaciimonas sp.]